MFNQTVLAQPEQSLVFTFLGVFLACDVIGLLLIIFFLPRLKSSIWVTNTSLKESTLACFSGLGDWKLTFMVPFIMSMAIEQGLMIADFTKVLSVFVSNDVK